MTSPKATHRRSVSDLEPDDIDIRNRYPLTAT